MLSAVLETDSLVWVMTLVRHEFFMKLQQLNAYSVSDNYISMFAYFEK